MIDIIYISYAKRDSNKTSGNLILFDEKESDIFCACSGGWGKGALPFGRYNIDRCYALRDNGNVKAYKREGTIDSSRWEHTRNERLYRYLTK